MGWRFEVWSHPSTTATEAFHRRILKLPVHSASFTPRNSGRGDGRFVLPPRYPKDQADADARDPQEGGHLGLILVRDPIDPSNDVRSLIRIYRDDDSTPVEDQIPAYEMVPTDIPDVLDPSEPIEILCEPLSSAGPRDARVLAWDWPSNLFPDWQWGGPNVLQNPGFEEGALRTQVIRIWTEATSGTFTITYNAQTTAAIDFDAAAGPGAGSIKDELEALSNITTVEVGGSGTIDSPWRIEFIDPGGGPLNSPSVNGGGLTPVNTAFVGIEQLGADGEPSGWERSYNRITGLMHGCHALDSFRLDDATPDTGTYSLYYNSDCIYGGIQQTVRVQPGQPYSDISMRVRPLVSGNLWRLVLRQPNESLIVDVPPSASTPFAGEAFTAGSYDDQIIAGTVVVPAGVTEMIFRHASVIDNAAAVTIDNAELHLGLPRATWGDIRTQLMDDAVIDARPLTIQILDWLDYSSFDATNDSNGDAWILKGSASNLLGFTAQRGQTYYHVDEEGHLQFGYENEIAPKPTPAGGFSIGDTTHDLRICNPRVAPDGGIGTYRADDPSVAYILGVGVAAGPLSMRALQGNIVHAEGADGLHAEAGSAASITAAGPIEHYVPDGTLTAQESVEAAAAENLDELLRQGLGIALTVLEGSGAPFPGIDVALGDTVRVTAGVIQYQPHRIDAYSIEWAEGAQTAQATTYLSAEVLHAQEAVTQGVVRLLERAAFLPPPESKKPAPPFPISCCPSCAAIALGYKTGTLASSFTSIDWLPSYDPEQILKIDTAGDLFLVKPGYYNLHFEFSLNFSGSAAGFINWLLRLQVGGNDAGQSIWNHMTARTTSGTYATRFAPMMIGNTALPDAQVTFDWDVLQSSAGTLSSGSIQEAKLTVVRHAEGCARDIGSE